MVGTESGRCNFHRHTNTYIYIYRYIRMWADTYTHTHSASIDWQIPKEKIQFRLSKRIVFVSNWKLIVTSNISALNAHWKRHLSLCFGMIWRAFDSMLEQVFFLRHFRQSQALCYCFFFFVRYAHRKSWPKIANQTKSKRSCDYLF